MRLVGELVDVGIGSGRLVIVVPCPQLPELSAEEVAAIEGDGPGDAESERLRAERAEVASERLRGERAEVRALWAAAMRACRDLRGQAVELSVSDKRTAGAAALRAEPPLSASVETSAPRV